MVEVRLEDILKEIFNEIASKIEKVKLLPKEDCGSEKDQYVRAIKQIGESHDFDGIKDLVQKILYQNQFYTTEELNWQRDKWLEIATKNAAISNDPHEAADKVMERLSLAFCLDRNSEIYHHQTMWAHKNGYIKVLGVDSLWIGPDGEYLSTTAVKNRFWDQEYEKAAAWALTNGYEPITYNHWKHQSNDTLLRNWQIVNIFKQQENENN